jgi:membrane dipeptidase
MNDSAWEDLLARRFSDTETIEIEGFVTIVDLELRQSYFLLTPNPNCCIGCIPRSGEPCIEIFLHSPERLDGDRVRVSGSLAYLENDSCGWEFQLRNACLAAEQPEREAEVSSSTFRIGRRNFLLGSAAAGLAACASEPPPPVIAADAKLNGVQILVAQRSFDAHSHAGRLIPTRTALDPSVADQRPFEDLAGPMKAGGLAVVCLAVVADTPVTREVDGRIRAMREPQPGELYRWAEMAYERAHRLIDGQGLINITDPASLQDANYQTPGAILASEGADFLEGQIDRLDEFFRREGLRQLQLVHYRVNELGDIQTAPPKHGGLTPFGVDVIKKCNDLGLVVDVAHGTFDLVKRAADVCSSPLLLSHTSLSQNPPPFSRLISPDHARLVAKTGGVIGVWPPTSIFPDLHALAVGMAQMVDVVGVDHVGLGTDMLGLTTTSVLRSYADLPQLANAMLATGFSAQEVGKILGGNYMRVFLASIATAFY